MADPVCDPTFSSWGFGGGAVSPPTGPGAEPRKQTHFGNNLFKFGLKSGLWIAVYTPNSGAKKRFKIEDGEIDGTRENKTWFCENNIGPILRDIYNLYRNVPTWDTRYSTRQHTPSWNIRAMGYTFPNIDLLWGDFPANSAINFRLSTLSNSSLCT